ncbi:MAG TPA: hypothetical protein VLZ74_14685 [Methylocella sp.]|nr:hypothetical protein [Methylocella sp.]
MARIADRIYMPNLDPKFVARVNSDGNWWVARFVENIDTLNKLAATLPRRLPWEYKTADEFKARAARIADPNQKLKLWWSDMLDQIQAFGLTSAWRLTEVASSAVWAIRRNDPICAAIMGRAGLETVANYAWFQTKVRPAIESLIENKQMGYVADLEDELLKTLFASRMETEEFYHPTNIVTVIRNIAKKIPHQEDVGPCYETLCEVSHPNMLGRSIYLSKVNGRTVISRDRGPSVAIIERATLLALSWASGTLPESVGAMQATGRRALEHFDIHHSLT